MKSFLNELEDVAFVIFYGSQLGQAKSIAEGLVDVAEEYDYKTKAFVLNVIKDVTDLAKLKRPIVIITSTTGDGEPPENADKFWRKIRKKSLSPSTLDSVKFTLLGLGDTNYNQFCQCGKEINRRLQDIGASTFYAPAWADDGVGLDLVVDEWIENLWPALDELLRPEANKAGDSTDAMSGKALTLPSCPASSLNLEWLEDTVDNCDYSKVDLKSPLVDYPLIEGNVTTATIKSTRVLSKPSALKTAVEVTLQFAGAPFSFEPGDAVNIISRNSISEVNQLLARLNLLDKAGKILQLSKKEGAKGKIPNFLPATIQLRSAFLYYFDIRSCPKKNFVRLLAEHTSDESEKSKLLELCSRQGSSKFEETIRFAGLSLLDILLTFPSCMPPLASLLEHLPRLIPRAYSISSSPLKDNKTFTFAFNIVTFPEENGRKYARLGVCTGWLYEKIKSLVSSSEVEGIDNLLNGTIEQAMNGLLLTEDNTVGPGSEEIVIYKRKNHNFRLPENLNAPVIMVGPGTGVAPFIGFLQHREKVQLSGKQVGEMSLYFGCRHKDRDFLYENELNSLKEGKILTKFYPVFSRDEPNSSVKYVQHRMEENKEEVIKCLFDDEGCLYVCGDARNMAKDVREVLIKCVQSVKGLTEAESKTLVAELSTKKRYLQDIWT